MPRQSQGADGVDESQPSNAPSGSWRLSLKEVRAWISVRVSSATDKVVAAARKSKIAVDIGGNNGFNSSFRSSE